jgi:hypothetical protein
VNLNCSNPQTVEQIVITPNQHLLPAGPRIERAEFEQLLQRAMEILSAPQKGSPRSRP